MAAGSRWGISPRESVKRECALRGEDAVVTGCVDLLRGREVDPALILALGGPPARWVVTGGTGGPDYWLRVWAARGLRYAYDDSAASALERALDDEHWRVREMAARACGHHGIDTALPRLAALMQDPIPRVQRAAERAILRISNAG